MVVLTVSGAAGAAPPGLTESQRVRLEATADDVPGSPPVFNQPGLYALLENAADWEPDDFAGATVPDLDALRDPAAAAEARGELMLIEGDLIRARRAHALTQQAGRFGEQLTEWVVQTGEDVEDVAVIYFADPQSELLNVIQGGEARVAARFYKLWQDQNQAGETRTYLTFVGAHPQLTRTPGTATARGERGGQTTGRSALVIGILFALGGFYLARRLVLARPTAARSTGPREQLAARRRHRATDPDDEPDDEPDEDLPDDPADALDTLLARRDDAADVLAAGPNAEADDPPAPEADEDEEARHDPPR